MGGATFLVSSRKLPVKMARERRFAGGGRGASVPAPVTRATTMVVAVTGADTGPGGSGTDGDKGAKGFDLSAPRRNARAAGSHVC